MLQHFVNQVLFRAEICYIKGGQKLSYSVELPVKDMAHEVLAMVERATNKAKKVMSELESAATGN